jgi:response regulator NasT
MTNVVDSASAATPAASLRVLIVEDDTMVGAALRGQLEGLGHTVVGQAADGDQALQLFRDQKPDVVLLDIRLDGSDGIQVATQLLAQRRCPMIVVSAYSDRELIQRASAAGVFGYLIKPVSSESLAAQIEVAVRRFNEQAKLIEENEALAQTLETRKLVERAKGILMLRKGISEPDAHRHLQQESQKRRTSMGELAKKIIESEELLGR